MPLHVTGHAIIRYQQRVEDVSLEQARQALQSPVVQMAADFGAPYVRLGTGQRVVIDDQTIVTVLPSEHSPGSMSTAHTSKYKEGW